MAVASSFVSEWNMENGRVSRAFDEWKSVEDEIGAFLRVTVRWVTSAHADAMNAAEAQAEKIFNPELYDIDLPVDLYTQEVGPLWPDNHLWMVNAAALRDSVTAFEVYLEKGAMEVLTPLGFAFRAGRFESPSWQALTDVHERLGNRINTDPVHYVRALRHLLTHQRGELRTPELREKFALEPEGDHSYRREVGLTQERLGRLMDDLATAVKECDRQIWGMVYGGLPVPDLTALTVGKRRPLVARPGQPRA